MSTRREVLRALFLLPMALGVPAAVSGCRFGGWRGGFRELEFGSYIEMRPNGRNARLEGELLLVGDDGIVSLMDDRVVFAAWDSMARLTFRGVPVDRLETGMRPAPEHHARMRQVSRYPFGLAPEQMSALLESYGQTEMDLFR